MKNDDLSEFWLSKEVKTKLQDKKLLKKELAEGKIPQEIIEFSNETMAKFYQAAHLLFEKKCYQEASHAFLFLATLNPHCHDYWLGLGMTTQLCHHYEEAIDAYELAALCDITSPVSYFYLAKCLFAIHDRENAVQALDLAIEMAADSEEYAELKQKAEAAKDALSKYEN